jgi:amino acid permease
MVMFCFVGFFSIPQTVEGLSWNKKLVPWAVVIGIGINFTFTFVTTVMAMLVSKEVTEVVIVGWGKALGPWAYYMGCIFVLLAILTSYWSVSYALAIVLVERFKWGYRASWLASTLPTLSLALSGIAGFLELLRMAGGAIAILVAIMVIPTLRASRMRGGEQVFDMGIWGGTAFQILIVLAYILAAVGSSVPIK